MTSHLFGEGQNTDIPTAMSLQNVVSIFEKMLILGRHIVASVLAGEQNIRVCGWTFARHRGPGSGENARPLCDRLNEKRHRISVALPYPGLQVSAIIPTRSGERQNGFLYRVFIQELSPMSYSLNVVVVLEPNFGTVVQPSGPGRPACHLVAGTEAEGQHLSGLHSSCDAKTHPTAALVQSVRAVLATPETFYANFPEFSLLKTSKSFV